MILFIYLWLFVFDLPIFVFRWSSAPCFLGKRKFNMFNFHNFHSWSVFETHSNSCRSSWFESQITNIKLKENQQKVPGPPPKLSASDWWTCGNFQHCPWLQLKNGDYSICQVLLNEVTMYRNWLAVTVLSKFLCNFSSLFCENLSQSHCSFMMVLQDWADSAHEALPDCQLPLPYREVCQRQPLRCLWHCHTRQVSRQNHDLIMLINCLICQTSNMRCTIIGNSLVDHSNVVGASPVITAPTTSSFLA